MSPIYIIQSLDSFLTEKKLKEIKKNYQIEETAVSHYDLEENTLTEVLEDLDTYSFLSPKKCIIVSNPFFLTTDNIKIEDNILKHFEKYINNPNPDHILIFILKKLDERKKIVKVLKEKANLLNLQEDITKLAKEWLNDYDLEPGALSLLVEYCNENISKLYQETEKLKLHSINDKKITKENICALVEKELDNSDTFLFSFINDIVNKNKKESIKKYLDLINLGHDPIAIIGMIANQFRFLYQVKALLSLNKTKEEIKQELSCHPYRIDKAKETIRYYTEEELLDYISQLAALDISIKSGEVIAKDGLENFLITL